MTRTFLLNLAAYGGGLLFTLALASVLAIRAGVPQ